MRCRVRDWYFSSDFFIVFLSYVGEIIGCDFIGERLKYAEWGEVV